MTCIKVIPSLVASSKHYSKVGYGQSGSPIRVQASFTIKISTYLLSSNGMINSYPADAFVLRILRDLTCSFVRVELKSFAPMAMRSALKRFFSFVQSVRVCCMRAFHCDAVSLYDSAIDIRRWYAVATRLPNATSSPSSVTPFEQAQAANAVSISPHSGHHFPFNASPIKHSGLV